MQLTRQHIQIVEKIVTTEQGTFLARFAVAHIAGTFKWKLLGMVPMPQSDTGTFSSPTLFIGTPKVTQRVSFIEPNHDLIVSPYSELSFFVSQPTRAPNFI
jgi:hypothetical protein